MGVTRREFLMRVGRAGGYSAAFIMMQSLGLLPIPAGAAEAGKLSPVSGKGKKVVILGGGIAGLVAAYELGKQGYSCTLLEARQRPGGRNWSVRKDSKVDFTDGLSQSCSFEEGHYFNAGPARLPSIHQIMLGYCRELGVPLEVEVNTSRSALMQSDKMNGGKAVEQRQMVNDTRGHVSELLAKCMKQGALDQQITAADKERMIEFLRGYGDLNTDLLYKGSERSGFKVFPGAAGQAGVPHNPLDMHELLDADLWFGLLSEDVIDWQATMFQPIGGMDRIPFAFARRLGDVIRYDAIVKQLHQDARGVTVVYEDSKSGKSETVVADYCICAMPLNQVAKLETNLSPDVKEVVDGATYDQAYKVAWEAPRFWEKDFNIYGGLSYLQQTVEIVWYPTAGLFSDTGVIVSGYAVENGSAFGKLPTVQAKLDASRRSVELLHPGYSRLLSKPVYVNWGKIAYNQGSWINGYGTGGRKGYDRICEPDGRIYFAGDHTSHIVGWQEGAALSAYRAINLIGQDVQKGGRNAA